LIEREEREGYQPCPHALCSQSNFTGDLDVKEEEDEKYILHSALTIKYL
jgi:hypothetical protein